MAVRSVYGVSLKYLHIPRWEAVDNNERTAFNVPNKLQISLIENVITFIPRQ